MLHLHTMPSPCSWDGFSPVSFCNVLYCKYPTTVAATELVIPCAQYTACHQLLLHDGKLNDVNGWCYDAIKSMWGLASYLNASRVASATPPRCNFISPGTDKPSAPNGWYSDVTDKFSYEERFGFKTKCPILLNISTSGIGVTGCKGNGSVFVLNQYGEGVCQGDYVFTTPVVETGTQTGVNAFTFMNAYQFLRQVDMLPSDMQSAQALFVDSTTTDVDGDGSGYYTITDVSLLFSPDAVNELVQGVRRRAEQRAKEYVFNDPAHANIVTAFMQLVFAIIVSWTLADKATAFAQWTWDKLRALLMTSTRWVGSQACHADRVACRRAKAFGKPVYMVVARFLIYASTVGAAVVSFLTSTSKGVGLSLIDGYPTMATQSLADPGGCANARFGRPAIGYVESATVYTEQQTWAVALVCVIAFVIVLIQATMEVVWLMKPVQNTSDAKPTSAATDPENPVAAGTSTPTTTV